MAENICNTMDKYIDKHDGFRFLVLNLLACLPADKGLLFHCTGNTGFWHTLVFALQLANIPPF